MKIWIALLVAPILVLTDQVVAFAVVGWACAQQRTIAVHAIHALFLIAVLASTLPALRQWRKAPAESGRDGHEAVSRRRFMTGVAVGVGLLSVAIVAAMWMPTWVIAACSA